MNHTHQYEPLPTPSGWGREERVFLTRLTDILDDIYLKWGRISEKDLSLGLRKEIRGKADAAELERYSSLEQTDSAIRAAVGSIRVGGRNLIKGTAHPLTGDGAGEMGRYETAGAGTGRGEEMVFSFDWESSGADVIRAATGGVQIGEFEVRAGTGHEAVKVTLTGGLGADVRFEKTGNGSAGVSRVQMEKGNQETDWGQAEGELVAGSGVEITQDAVRIQTETFEVGCGGNQYMALDAAGGYFPRLWSPQTAPRYDGPEEMTVGGGEADGVSRFNRIGEALSQINGKWLEKDVTIHVAAAYDEYDPVEIRGLAGFGSLTVEAGDMKAYAPVLADRCQAAVYLMDMNARCAAAALTVRSCAYVRAEGCAFETDSGDHGAVEIREGSAASFAGTAMAAGKYALWAMDGSRATIVDCSGDKSLCSDGAFVIGSGRLPSASASNVTTVSLNNGYISVSGTPDRTGGVDGSGVDVDGEAHLYPRQTAYYWGAWNGGGDMAQGYAPPSGQMSGCAWFDVSAYSGRSAAGGKLRLTRKAGWGQSGAVTVLLYGLSPQCVGTGSTFARKNSYGVIGTLPPGATRTLTLPKRAMDDLIGGTIGGLCLCAPDSAVTGTGYSENYARFYGVQAEREEDRPRLSIQLIQ